MNQLNQPAAELELFTFFQMTPDLVCIADKAGYFKRVNQAVIDKLGYTREELLAQPIASFIFPEDRAATRQRREKLLKGSTLVNFENRYVDKQGVIIWLEWSSVYIADKELVFAIAKDITTRKKVEAEIEEKIRRYSNLATHFKSSIEDDRKYLATELHEELAQLAAVIKMDIEWINEQAPDLPAAVKSRIAHASIVAELLLNTIRRISFSISPAMLSDLGLSTTLEWQCREFSLLSNIPSRFTGSYDETRLSGEIKTDFFRLCQEALNNVIDHTLASNVVISLVETTDQMVLSITDQGKGFEASRFKETAAIIRMRERALSINGQLLIETKPGHSTSLMVIVAL